MKQLSVVCMLIAALFLLPVSSVENSVTTNEGNVATVNMEILDGGWLEERDGVKILHVSGTNYEMGYQHGYLLKDEIEQNYRAIFCNDVNGETYNFILDVWNTEIKFHIIQEYIDEIQGLADGSGMTVDDVIVFLIGQDFFVPAEMGCMEMAAWGPATVDGELRHMYSSDWHLQVRDPESGVYMQENQFMMLRQPENGHDSLQFCYAGAFPGCGGVNEHELAISIEASGSTEFTFDAAFFWFRVLMVLDYASSAEEAIDIMDASRCGGMNYIISDGKTPIAFVFEETVNFSYVGTWDDEIESLPPFWDIDHVVRRKNMYIHPDTSATQRPFYDPRIFYLNSIYTGQDYFNTWRYYKTLSEEIDNLWGTLDNDNIMSMVLSIYRAETDIVLRFYEILGLEQFPSHHQWVICPATGDIVVSFADGELRAQYNDTHYFNFYNLLEAEPP
jgi:hypothetical protein